MPAPAERFREVHPTLFDLGGLLFELKSLPCVSGDRLASADLPVEFRARMLAEASPRMTESRVPYDLEHVP